MTHPSQLLLEIAGSAAVTEGTVKLAGGYAKAFLCLVALRIAMVKKPHPTLCPFVLEERLTTKDSSVPVTWIRFQLSPCHLDKAKRTTKFPFVAS